MSNVLVVSRTTYEKIKRARIGNAWDESGVKFFDTGRVGITLSNELFELLDDEDPEGHILRLLNERR